MTLVRRNRIEKRRKEKEPRDRNKEEKKKERRDGRQRNKFELQM